jgi:hypothetical protein
MAEHESVGNIIGVAVIPGNLPPCVDPDGDGALDPISGCPSAWSIEGLEDEAGHGTDFEPFQVWNEAFG